QLLPHSATSPRRENEVVNEASSPAKRRSQQATIGTAMPATGPLTAAMIGLRIERRYVYVPRNDSPMLGSPGSAASSGGSASAPFPSLMPFSMNRSAPAQKPRPAPVRMIATTRWSASA